MLLRETISLDPPVPVVSAVPTPLGRSWLRCDYWKFTSAKTRELWARQSSGLEWDRIKIRRDGLTDRVSIR